MPRDVVGVFAALGGGGTTRRASANKDLLPRYSDTVQETAGAVDVLHRLLLSSPASNAETIGIEYPA